jgi:hypothetical protein
MEIGTTITGLVLIALLVMPFLLMSSAKKAREKRTLNRLKTEASQLNCTITEYELTGNDIIGIDQKAGMVFFGKTKGENWVSQTVNLADFRSCEIVAKNRSKGKETGNDIIVDKLELLFRSSTSGKGDIALEFYNGMENFQLNDELPVMKKWVEIINDNIPAKV